MGNRDTPEVKTAGKADAERVMDTLVLSFASDPVARWLYPNTHDYLQHFPELFELFTGKAFDHGTVKHVRDFSGVALWLPPGVHPDGEAMAEYICDTVSEERQETALATFEALDDYHPDEPHWHFTTMGVDPQHQRKGFGKALSEQVLAEFDEQEVPVYLEASNTNSASLMLQHGFEILGMVNEGTMPPFIPMLRRP